MVVMVKSVSGAFGRTFGPIDFGLAAVALWQGPWSGLRVHFQMLHLVLHRRSLSPADLYPTANDRFRSFLFKIGPAGL